MTIISLIQSGTSYTLHSGGDTLTPLLADADGLPLSEIWVEEIDGAGMAPLHRLTERGPQQHGATDRGFLLDPRSLLLILGMSATTLSAFQSARDYIVSLLTPTNTPLSLRFDRDDGSTRQIDAHVSTPPQFATKDRIGLLYQKVGVVFGASSPLWYDPVQVAETFGASGAAAGMGIPWKIPWKLGASSISQSRAITYTGTFETSPVIRIDGPITSPVITNVSSPDMDTLDFTGTTIAGGAWYEVDTENKTVLDNAGANQIAKLINSDLATFALHPHPIAPGGVNTILVGGTGISTTTQVYLNYYRRFISGS